MGLGAPRASHAASGSSASQGFTGSKSGVRPWTPEIAVKECHTASILTLGSPWTRSAPLAARGVAERWQNAPAESLESWRAYPRLAPNESRACSPGGQTVLARNLQAPWGLIEKLFIYVACGAYVGALPKLLGFSSHRRC
jgi:hypothetical protein